MNTHPASDTRRKGEAGHRDHLADLAALLRSFESGPDPIIPLILRHAAKGVGGHFAVYNTMDENRRMIVTHSGFRLPLDFRRRGRLRGRICYEELVKAAKPAAVIADVGTTGYGASDPDVRRYHLKAYIGVPVHLQGRVIGSLAVYDVRPRMFTEQHVHWLTIMAGIAQWKPGCTMARTPDGARALNDRMFQLSSMAIYRLDLKHQQLEALVEERTRELSRINRKLRAEVQKGTELKTAMRVLLDKSEEERLRIEENVRVNLVQLIEPYLERLGRSGLNASQQQFLDLIRLNTNEVLGSPMPELSAKYYVFSPAELQVANLIRKGRSTKEVACLLNLSPRTVEAYRNSIRRKLGLRKKKVNLKTYLSAKEY